MGPRREPPAQHHQRRRPPGSTVHTRRRQLLIRIITWVGWLAWLVFAISLVVELVAQISGRTIHLPGLRVPQLAAAPLVAMLLAVFVAAPVIVGAASGVALANPGDSTGPPTSLLPLVRASSRPLRTAQQSHPPRRRHRSTTEKSEARKDIRHTVERGDTLWGLAKHYYGDGMKWKKLAKANADLVGESGSNYLEVGWTLTIPDTATQRDAPSIDNPRPGTTYTVERGDTLSDIADDAYGTPERVAHHREGQPRCDRRP